MMHWCVTIHDISICILMLQIKYWCIDILMYQWIKCLFMCINAFFKMASVVVNDKLVWVWQYFGFILDKILSMYLGINHRKFPSVF